VASSSSRQPTSLGVENSETNGHGSTPEEKSGWLVGKALEKAQIDHGWEERLDVRWPFRQNKEVEDWDGREYTL